MKTWIIRILMSIIVLVALMIGGLNLLAGTSDAHRNGLESAFTGALRGETTFGALTAFNIFPQFSVDIDKLYASGVYGRGDLQARTVKFSFNFIDLILKRRRINSIEINDLVIDKGVFTDQRLSASSITIIPPKDETSPYLNITGQYGDMPLIIAINMEQASNGIPPSYQFTESNNFYLTLGKSKIAGAFTPETETHTALKDLSFDVNGQGCSTLKNRFTMQSFTSNIFPGLVKLESKKTADAEDVKFFCKDIMRFSL